MSGVLLVGDDLWTYLESKGVTRHDHPNGLGGCWSCVQVVVTGKSLNELDKEHEEYCAGLAKQLGLTDSED